MWHSSHTAPALNSHTAPALAQSFGLHGLPVGTQLISMSLLVVWYGCFTACFGLCLRWLCRQYSRCSPCEKEAVLLLKVDLSRERDPPHSSTQQCAPAEPDLGRQARRANYSELYSPRRSSSDDQGRSSFGRCDAPAPACLVVRFYVSCLLVVPD